MMPGTKPPPAISALRQEYVSAAGAAAAVGGAAWGVASVAAVRTATLTARARVIRVIDHFLVGAFAGGRVAGRHGTGMPLDCPEWISREARSGAGLGALPAGMNKLLAPGRDACQRGKRFPDLRRTHSIL